MLNYVLGIYFRKKYVLEQSKGPEMLRNDWEILTLSENIKDKELSKFYYDLMASEARHYTLFLKLAKKYGTGVDVDSRWKEFLAEEAIVIAGYGNEKTVHG